MVRQPGAYHGIVQQRVSWAHNQWFIFLSVMVRDELFVRHGVRR